MNAKSNELFNLIGYLQEDFNFQDFEEARETVETLSEEVVKSLLTDEGNVELKKVWHYDFIKIDDYRLHGIYMKVPLKKGDRGVEKGGIYYIRGECDGSSVIPSEAMESGFDVSYFYDMSRLFYGIGVNRKSTLGKEIQKYLNDKHENKDDEELGLGDEAEVFNYNIKIYDNFSIVTPFSNYATYPEEIDEDGLAKFESSDLDSFIRIESDILSRVLKNPTKSMLITTVEVEENTHLIVMRLP